MTSPVLFGRDVATPPLSRNGERVLAHIRENPGCTLGEIAAALRMTRQQAGFQAETQLVNRGLVAVQQKLPLNEEGGQSLSYVNTFYPEASA